MNDRSDGPTPKIPREIPREINAITLFTGDMAASVAFYRAVGMEVVFGGPDAGFTTLAHGANFVNLSAREGPPPDGLWGRVILWVPSPDDTWAALVAAGHEPEFEPRDAPWGERYFHVRDPDGHQISFARRLDDAR
jgi:catechol 2,3-dioxygenase-like lactoylglutathione lyase family enzyme